VLIFLAFAIGAGVLARHNFRSGRGDKRGATRIAISLLTLMFVAWLIGSQHSLDPLTELGHFLDDFGGEQLMNAGFLWVIYLALEPYVRRYSPDILMSWSRMLSGRFRDPRVGRDILVGICAGLLIALIRCAIGLVPPHFGMAPPPPQMPSPSSLEFLLSTRRALAMLLRLPSNALFLGMLCTLGFALSRMLVKRTWAAALIAGLLLAFLQVGGAGTEYFWLNVLYAVSVAVVYVGVLVSFGMLAQMFAFLTSTLVLAGGLTADLSRLYAPTSIWLIALVAAAAAFGFYASRAGEPLFGKFET
jgi:hypothetical protein